MVVVVSYQGCFKESYSFLHCKRIQMILGDILTKKNVFRQARSSCLHPHVQPPNGVAFLR